MIIPWQELAPETLNRLIESFVLREGTDYGDDEVALADKVQQVLLQLKQGQVLIVYSQIDETVDLLTQQQYRQLAASLDAMEPQY